MALSIGNLIVLIFTFSAIIWYSCETYQLRLITAKTLALQLRPYIICFIKDDHDTNSADKGQRIYIKNTGQGMAKNIIINSNNFNYSDKSVPEDKTGKGIYAKKFDSVPSLMAGDDFEIFVFKDDNNKVEPKHLRLPSRNEVKIIFENLLGDKYFTDLEVAPNTSRVVLDGEFKEA